jgi:serine phosphatase RsbU (regulator of sigma subunit)
MTFPARAFRPALLALALFLLSALAATLWRFGSSPTDENLFTRPPSGVALMAAVPGRVVQDGRPGSLERQALRPGDFVVAVDGRQLFSPETYLEALAAAGTTIRVGVARGWPKVDLDIDAAAADLGAAPWRDVRQMAFVIDVTPEGASARAGMRVGDLIVSINGKSFATVLEADAILRSGTVGHSTEYVVLREGKPVTLSVTLVYFGLPLAALTFALAGLAFMAVGVFLGVARPAITAARYQGVALLLIGYALAGGQLGRASDAGVGRLLREVTVTAAFFLGMAIALHASLYFPKARPSVLARRWVVPVAYALASAGIVASLASGHDTVFALLFFTMLAYVVLIRWLGRGDMTSEMRPAQRGLDVTAGFFLAPVMFVLWHLVRNRHFTDITGIVAGLLLLLVPAGQLWVIGRYRLLDLNLRVRRHIQYAVVSTAWKLLPLAVLAWVVVALPTLPLPIPHVRIGQSAVEVLASPLASSDRVVLEKIVLMVAAIVAAFALRRVARRGEQWIARQFYRTKHDYRRAAREVATLVTARPHLDGLAAGLMDALVKLLQLKRAGVVFFHQQETYWAATGHGFSDAEWQRLARASADIHEGVRSTSEAVAAEYASPRLRRLLTEVDALYLYPLRSRDELVGAAILGEKLAEDAFRDEDFEFVGALAIQVAPAVENAFLYNDLAHQERMRHELEIARRIQIESLPQYTPRVEGLDIAGVSIPAFEVGGDYFDYLNGDPRHLTVMVGDVSGKGTSAALYMSKLQGIVRSLHVFDLSPREFFVRTNDLLSRDLEHSSFVTAIGGFFDASRRQMVLARAGHLPLFYFSSATGDVERVLPRGMGFGLSGQVLFERELEARVIAYRPGDVFLFITDGITECLGPSGDDFGEERVAGLLRRHAGGTACDIRDEVTSAVRAFAASAEQSDDQTVVVVKATA